MRSGAAARLPHAAALRDDRGIVASTALENPRAFCAKAARALAGRRSTGDGVMSWLSSRFDPFLNQVFVGAGADLAQGAERLALRPGFVWAASDPGLDAERRFAEQGFVLTSFAAMRSGGEQGPARERRAPTPAPVRSPDEVAAWHAVYGEVLGADPRSLPEWQRLYARLGPDGDGSLLLWVAAVDGEPAATAALFLDGTTAGLYCFATREPFRRRGLAGELVAVCRAHARDRGALHCVLQASAAGRPVYAEHGFSDVGRLPILVRRAPPR